MGRPTPPDAATPASDRSDHAAAAGSTAPLPTAEDLRTRLAELVEKSGIPGASLAVRVGDRTVATAVGVLDVETEYPATTDSVFQIGSITKVWTTTLVMQLVDEGLIDLDVPVRTYIPDLRLVDEDAAARMTTRHLLCHTAGFEGELFDDHGNGDDSLARLVASLATVGEQLFPPGETFSYSNAGFDLLGRIVEVCTGVTWEQALRDRIVAPLGLTHVANNATESILLRTAIGHIGGPDGTNVKAPVHHTDRNGAPSGSALAMTATDLLEFAAAHIRLGQLPDGKRLLSEESARAMREPQIEIGGDGAFGARLWGLGWILYDWSGGEVIGHDGGTIGQGAMLRVVPERDVSIALLTNGGALYGVYDLICELLETLADVRPPAPAVPPAEPPAVDTSYLVGSYASPAQRFDIAETEDGLVVTTQLLGRLGALLGNDTMTMRVVPSNERMLISTEAAGGRHQQFLFLGEGERAEFLHVGRAMRRIPDAGAE
ncbi:serine hydrolase domain-containing protein [Embleya sp. NPDC055664]